MPEYRKPTVDEAPSGRERVCTSLPPTPPDVPFGIRRFLKLGCGFSGQAFDKRL